MKSFSQDAAGVLVHGVMVDVLAYADDTVLLAPSWRALQALLHLLDKLSTNVDTTCRKKGKESAVI